jgi:hypothetical protein
MVRKSGSHLEARLLSVVAIGERGHFTEPQENFPPKLRTELQKLQTKALNFRTNRIW